MKIKISLLAALLFTVATAFASQPRKVLIIGIDGTRSDALQQANTPNIDGLLVNGLYTFNAWHCGITISGPSWSDIMCGVWEDKHGVLENSYAGSNYDEYPYFTTRAKELKPSLYMVQVAEWAALNENVTNEVWDKKIQVPDGGGVLTADSAVANLANPNLDAMFVYFDAVDLTGHDSGFDPNNAAYISAIEGVDGHIGTILNALYARPNYAAEDWLILVITDHGGNGTLHGLATDMERQIWWIANGASVEPQELVGGDPGTYQQLYQLLGVPEVDPAILAVSPVQTDIAVTALHHLIYDTGTNPEDVEAWDLDGKSWLKTFTGLDDKSSIKPDVAMYPNPASDLVTLWFENKKGDKVEYTVFNAEGKLVNVPAILTSAQKITLNFEGNADGVYFVNLAIGNTKITKRLMLSQAAPRGTTAEPHDHTKCNGKH